MSNYEKTSRDYLEAWRTSQAEMQQLRDELEAERERVRVLREALLELNNYALASDDACYGTLSTVLVIGIAEKTLATTEQEDV